MSDLPKVVVTRSLSYSGTTWMSLIAGTNSRVAAVGPPDLLWRPWINCQPPSHRLPSREVRVLVDELSSKPPERGSFVRRLTEVLGRDIVLFDNPSQEFEKCELHSYPIHEVVYFRDVKRVLESYSRLHPGTSYRDQLGPQSWFLPTLQSLKGHADRCAPVLLLSAAARNSKLIGLALERLLGEPDIAVQDAYWRYPCLMFGGNSGPLSLVSHHIDPSRPIEPRYEALYRHGQEGAHSMALADSPQPPTRWSFRDTLRFEVAAGTTNRRLKRLGQVFAKTLVSAPGS